MPTKLYLVFKKTIKQNFDLTKMCDSKVRKDKMAISATFADFACISNYNKFTFSFRKLFS